MKRSILILVLLTGTVVFGQTNLNFERFLISGEEESNYLISDYLSPGVQGIMSINGSSWFSTAKPHDRYGFDISLNFMGANIPSGSKFFNAGNYQNMEIQGNTSEIPTVVGNKGETPRMQARITTDDGGYLLRELDAPTGFGWSIMPYAALQGGFGLGWGTDINLRFLPNIGAKTFKTGLWGIGIKHEITYHFDFRDKKPLYVSTFIGYTKSKAKWILDPDDSQWTGDDQHTNFGVGTYTFQLLGTTNMDVFNVFAALGYNISKADYEMMGTYNVNYSKYSSDDVYIGEETIVYSDPSTGEYKQNEFNATLGFNVTYNSFRFSADYTFKKFNTFNIGIAFTYN